jgi:hypothetical protein
VNKKEGIDVPRIFVQGKFVKRTSRLTESPHLEKQPGNVSVSENTPP